MMSVFHLLRILFSLSFVLSLLCLGLAFYSIDSCYTDPCLSTDYDVNILKLGVANSVNSVMFGFILLISPVFGIYIMYMRCRLFTGGVLNGVFLLTTMTSSAMTILWGDIYTTLKSLTNDELLIFGSEYVINEDLITISKAVAILCFVITAIDGSICLILLIYRSEYCVDYYVVSKPQSSLRPYQSVALSDE